MCGQEVTGCKFTGCHMNEAITEDACWLLPIKDTQYINAEKFDALLKKRNQSCTKVAIKSDICKHELPQHVSQGNVRLNTKAGSEMFIRRQLDTLTSQIKENNLSVDLSSSEV